VERKRGTASSSAARACSGGAAGTEQIDRHRVRHGLRSLSPDMNREFDSHGNLKSPPTCPFGIIGSCRDPRNWRRGSNAPSSNCASSKKSAASWSAR
jgi:hypothetical protein